MGQAIGSVSGGPMHAIWDDIVIDDDKAFYIGDKATEGSWRIVRSGDNLLMQRLESSVWVTKDTITP